MDRHMTHVIGMMAEMLASGEQADLTFRCSDGTELKAHRLIAGSRSAVISAACNGPYKVSGLLPKSFSIPFVHNLRSPFRYKLRR